MNRHDHAILLVARDLAGASSDGAGAEYDALAEWLRWRVHDGWQPSCDPRRAYDRAVRKTAICALRLYLGDRYDSIEGDDGVEVIVMRRARA